MRIVYKVLAIVLLGSLLGCATGSTILTGTKREPGNPYLVKLYLDPPEKYESIGIVEVSSNVVLSRQAAQDKAMSVLKAQAAKIGANGVLLTNTGSKTVESAGYFSEGIYYGGGSSDKIVAQGRAIFVIQE